MLEFLTESDVPDSVKDVVEVIGMDAFKDLVKLAGGSNLYIPNESNLVKPIRNRMIRDEFKGRKRERERERERERKKEKERKKER